jgi:prepilin-type N-terminal cleavage/methylation domain-containing protein
MARQPSFGEKALTMVELMIALAILAVVMLGAFSTLHASARQNQYFREEAAALRAAQAELARVRNAELTSSTTPSRADYTFTVALVEGQPAGSRGLLEISGSRPEGEVVFIADETPDESDYGMDLDGNGYPDGVDLNGDGIVGRRAERPDAGFLFPLDLNGDGAIDVDPLADRSQMKLVPVIVIIRWRSFTGIEGRVELMTVIGG